MCDVTNIGIVDLIQVVVAVVLLTCPFLLTYLAVNKFLTKSRFSRFLGILAIGCTASLVPMGPLGIVFGFPAVLISSIAVSIFLDKETK